jgi:hypothetical protein
MEIVRELKEVEINSTPHPRRRIVVLRREDGCFTVAEQYHYASEYGGEIVAEGWQTLPPNGLYASLELAEAEALAASTRMQSADC